MANEFDGDFTGFDAVSYDRYQAEREYEDSMDSEFGDFEPNYSFYEDTEFPEDFDGDLQSHDAEFDADDDFDHDVDFPYGMDDDYREYDDPLAYTDEY